jgi:putative protein-disulfide isomerase
VAPGPPAVTLEYFTDPLCAWSWAFEGPWRRLRVALGDRLAWRYRMGGLLAAWDRYEDPVHCVSRPAQMAPHWFEVRQVCGVSLDERLWLEDPPASSYPACLAVKAAELQAARAGEQLLGRLREAAMLQRRNIARWDVIQAVAEELAAQEPEAFDASRFAADLDRGEVAEAFREDLRRAQQYGIGRFPALVVSGAGGPPALLIGYRPYEVLRETLEQVAPHLRPLFAGADGPAPASP